MSLKLESLLVSLFVTAVTKLLNVTEASNRGPDQRLGSFGPALFAAALIGLPSKLYINT